MTPDEAIEKIRTITPANGYVYTPSTVGPELTDRPRAVQVTEVDGELVITIAGGRAIARDGRAVDRMKTHIAGVLGPVTFATETINKENSRATTTTTTDNRSQGGKRHRNRRNADGDGGNV